jgi:ABC-type uncharacterized transport system involved in gliding motility auxiliary subunit
MKGKYLWTIFSIVLVLSLVLSACGAPATEAPKQEAPKEEAPAQEAPKEEAPAQEAPKEEAPAQEAPKEEPQHSSRSLISKKASLTLLLYDWSA